MTDEIMTETMRMVRKSMEDTMRVVRTSLAAFAPAQRQALSSKQQLSRFLAMTPENFERLKQRHGEESFNRYMVRMRQLAEEGV